MTAFTVLKDKLVRAPILRHFDPDRRPVVVVYASKWAISAALMQDHDGIYQPVNFTSRTLKPNEINYGVVDKEVMALLRVLDVCYTQLVTRSIKVLTRHSTLAWLVNSSGLQGRLGRWTALLSGWTLEIVKCSKGEDEILGVTAASITPREEVDAILTSIAPRKQPRQAITMLPPTVELDEKLLVVSFDGSARVKRSGGAFSAVVWSLPEWTVISAALKYKADLTGAAHSLWRFKSGIRQMRGKIECKAPSLKLLRQKAMERLRSWPDHAFHHVKRESADRLAGAALQREDGAVVLSDAEREDRATLNRLDELLVPRTRAAVVKIAAVTRPRRWLNPEVLQETLVQRLRMERIARAQDEEKWIVDLKKYVLEDVQDLTSAEAKSCAKIAEDYEVDAAGLLFYCPPSKQANEDRDQMTRLVIPETLQEDFLHHYHVSLEGGHQGIGRTFQRLRAHFHWRGLYQSVQRYVGRCVDCETGKGRPAMAGESPGNLQATYPF